MRVALGDDSGGGPGGWPPRTPPRIRMGGVRPADLVFDPTIAC